MILFIGAILGLLSVAFGAWFEHGIRPTLSAEQFSSLSTALLYQQIHAIVLIAIGFARLSSLHLGRSRLFGLASLFLVIGILLFSGSIYLNLLADVQGITAMAPFGGISLMAGWLTIAWSGLVLRAR